MHKATFRDYLADRHQNSTIKAHEQNLGYFMRWIVNVGLPEAKKAAYGDLLAYVQHEKNRGLDIATINLRLSSIRKYYAFLQERGQVIVNPVTGLRIRGKLRKVIEQPFCAAELESLYQAYAQREVPLRHHMVHVRNTCLAGLLIYQGLHSGELQRLEVGHLRLADGKIHIPGSTRSNARELPLCPRQILTLDQYLRQVRPGLHTTGPALFSGHMRNLLAAIIPELQLLNPNLRSALHIRASVILGWLKIHNKRRVQYMAGHRHISSTERYSVQELDTLIDQLNKHHPFG